MTNRFLFAFCILNVALAGCAKRPPVAPAAPAPPVDPAERLRTDFDALVDQPGHLHGSWGIVVESLARGDRLYERNPKTLLVPASTMKLVTVAVAVEAVGWEYQFETRALTTGPVVHGALRGDLLVVGSGDPSLSGREGDGDAVAEWIAALRERGVSRVDGRVVADDDDAEEPAPGFGWSWEDLGYTYGAVPGALNLAENKVDISVSPGTAPGQPTIVELPPDARGLAVVNRSTTGTADIAQSLRPESRPGDRALSIYGSIPVGAQPALISVAAGNPTLWFARVVRNRLLAAGIDVTGPPVDADDLPVKPDRSGAVLLHAHRSVPLSRIAAPLLEDSINLYAEAVLRLATGPQGPRTTAASLDAVRARLAAWGIPREGIQIVDGSGLSRRNVIAPDTLVAILRRLHDSSGSSPWMEALAIAGREGTLEKRMKGTAAEGNALAKTGSMSNIRTIAGYITTTDGEPLAFAILANNFEGPASAVNATIDRLVARLAAFSRRPNSHS